MHGGRLWLPRFKNWTGHQSLPYRVAPYQARFGNYHHCFFPSDSIQREIEPSDQQLPAPSEAQPGAICSRVDQFLSAAWRSNGGSMAFRHTLADG
jgi:hypothetical protein